MAEMLRRRSEIDKKYQWRMEDLYADDGAWQKDYEALKEEIGALAAYKGRLMEGGGVLCELLKARDAVDMRFEKVYVYANQKLHEDTAESRYQEMSGKAQSLAVLLSGAEAFITPEILGLGEELLERYFQEIPELSLYRHYIEEILRDREHTLSWKEEELLARSGEMAEGPRIFFPCLTMPISGFLRFGARRESPLR